MTKVRNPLSDSPKVFASRSELERELAQVREDIAAKDAQVSELEDILEAARGIQVSTMKSAVEHATVLAFTIPDKLLLSNPTNPVETITKVLRVVLGEVEDRLLTEVVRGRMG